MNLKWPYFSSKGHYISYKVTTVLKKNSLTPVLILIHNKTPHKYPKKKNNIKIKKEIKQTITLL